MKKVLGVISWVIAIAAAIGITLTTTVIHEYILFYISLGGLIVGIIGILIFSPKTREYIFDLLNII